MKKNKKKIVVIVVLSLFLFPFISSVLRPAIEGYAIPDDVAGLKLSTSANFYAISESEQTTRWILQNASLTPLEDFHDDISGSNWDLIDVSEIIINTNYIPTDDAYVRDDVPDSNYGSGSALTIWYYPTQWTFNVFIKYEYPYLDLNCTSNSTIKYYGINNIDGYGYVYHTTDFNEETITWNNQPTTGAFQSEWAGADGWQEEDIGTPNYYYKLISKSDMYRIFNMYSSETTKKPIIYHHLSKNYQGGGMMYMQTNTTELISLKSTDYGTHYNLSSGDYFEVDFQTSSDSQINLILLKDGVVNKTLTLSQSGNTNFNNQTAKISVDEFVEFDQLKISSTFEDTDNVKIYDIKTYKYTLAGDYADFYVGSKRTHSVNLTSDTYNLRIFDPYDGDVKIDENVIIGTTDYFYVYEPTSTIDCRLTLFNTGKENHLDFTDYHISINRSLNGEWSIFDLLDNIFTADKETHVYINVSDSFDTLIDSFDELTASYIDLELEVYSLQIKNLMEYQTIVDINSSYTYPLLPFDSLYFILSKQFYQIGYYDDDNDYEQFLIYLNSNQAYVLNRSQMCFLSYQNAHGDYLNFRDYITTINDSIIYEQVFYGDIGTDVNITVKDFYNTILKTQNYTIISGDNYIPLTLSIYELKIRNERFNPVQYNLTNVDTNENRTGSLFEDEILTFYLANKDYKFNYLEDGKDEWIFFEFTLDSDKYFVLNRSQMCFLSYTNQRGDYLNFNQFKTYWNGTLLYENVFYDDIGNNVSLEIMDHYNISVQNHTFIVSSGDNYESVVLTMFSLKVFNQQEVFNHINITRDPNYYESGYYWSEWIAPGEIIDFKLFAGYYKINLTDNENSGSSYYSYTLNGDDILLISSGNTISNLIINIANVNTTIGNQITNVQIDLTNQNSNINNTIINIEINLSNVNSTLGNLLTNINLDIININNNISNLYTFTENNFLNLGNNINNSFISIENNIIAINQTISTLVIGLDGKITIVNATITTMFTEMNSQFVIVQSTLDFSFAFLNQTIIQIGNNITNNQIALNNLIIQRANEIDNSLIQISTLVNLINSSVVNESLVIQSLVNIIGNNITENHIIINDLINLIGNNITENNINMISLIELVGNNITTNHFVIQTLIDYVSNNITENHLEFLTNINLINNTIGQNQIELINKLLFINNSINEMALDLTNQILLVNNTIYSAILDVSTSIEFNSDNILGNISLTYQQNDFLTELYKETMFSQLLNWSDVAFNYSLMEVRIDVWEFINLYKDKAVEVQLKYEGLIETLIVSAQNTVEQYLPSEDVEYRLWSVEDEEYLTDWEELPDTMTVDFGFYEAEVPITPEPIWFSPELFYSTLIIAGIVGIVIAVLVKQFKKSKAQKIRRRTYKSINQKKNPNGWMG